MAVKTGAKAAGHLTRACASERCREASGGPEAECGCAGPQTETLGSAERTKPDHVSVFYSRDTRLRF